MPGHDSSSGDSAPLRLPGDVPIPWLVIGVPLAAIALVGAFVIGKPAAPSDDAMPQVTADVTFEDRADGAVDVLCYPALARVATLAPGSNSFARVTLSGFVRERRRESAVSRARPFTLSRWPDGRLTLRDGATGHTAELTAFGPDNEAAFARWLHAASESCKKAEAVGGQRLSSGS